MPRTPYILCLTASPKHPHYARRIRKGPFHHTLEELHRHSGHADILREAVDGAQMYELRSKAEGIDMSYIEKWFAAHADELYA